MWWIIAVLVGIAALILGVLIGSRDDDDEEPYEKYVSSTDDD